MFDPNIPYFWNLILFNWYFYLACTYTLVLITTQVLVYCRITYGLYTSELHTQQFYINYERNLKLPIDGDDC